MRILIVVFVLSITSAQAWKVDRRCTMENQLVTGHEVDHFMDEEEPVPFELDDESFDWDALSFFDSDSDKKSNLRGSDFIFQNDTSLFTNTSRQLASGRSFNLKLYWRQGYCWQDEWIERKWCMECRNSCDAGDKLEIKTCSRKSTQRFQWDGGKLKVAGKNMCLTKKSNGLNLQPCGGSNQGFRGYQSSGGFQLKPASSSKCLSQQHHPKSGEIIKLYNCGLAAQHNTDKWNVYW